MSWANPSSSIIGCQPWRHWVLAGMLAWTGVSAAGCGRSPQEPITVLLSGDTAGWITPCGCAANQSGGLARRATLIQQSRELGATVYADVGGSASGTSAYHRLKLAAILRGMNQMGLVAHNLGGPETQFTPADLHELAEQTGVTWISANLEPRDAAAANPARSHVVMQVGGRRMLVVGVVDPQFVNTQDWQVRDPIPAILRVLEQAKEEGVIVMAYFDEPGLRKIAEALPEVNLVVGGPTGQVLQPTMVGPTSLASATNKGKFLIRAKFTAGESGNLAPACDVVEVASTISEHQDQIANLNRFYDQLAEHDLTAADAGLVAAPPIVDSTYRYAGSMSCRSCHQEDFAVWEKSRHAHAWAVLQAKRAQFDSYCQQCHTTGYGQAGGFVNVAQSPDRVDVGCENCHGPSAAHVADPRQKTPYAARDQCVACHDHENSPEYDWERYWPKIVHGAKSDVPASGRESTATRRVTELRRAQ